MVIFLSQLLGQWSFVVKKLQRRGILLTKLMFLSVKRAIKLFKPVELVLYLLWLFVNFGWRRHLVNYFRYYRSITSFILKYIVLGIVFVYAYLKFDFNAYCNYVFGLFSNPILSEKGYLPYAIVISCSLVWITLLVSFVYFKSLRALVKPYLSNLIILNLVIFVLLMSLFAKVGRAKFGIRVWYPTEREYGGRLGFEFWD